MSDNGDAACANKRKRGIGGAVSLASAAVKSRPEIGNRQQPASIGRYQAAAASINARKEADIIEISKRNHCAVLSRLRNARNINIAKPSRHDAAYVMRIAT